MKKIFIIAEAGVNHNGKIEIAKKMIDVAVKAGADAVKFQTFVAKNEISKNAKKANYQKVATGNNESQLEMVRKLELDPQEHKELISYCKNNKIMFLSSPFDLDSIDLLAKLKLRTIKIPSGEITNLPYLRKIGALNKKLIVSTGMSRLFEIDDAINVLVKNGTKRSNISLLHCNTEYPTPYEDANLKAMLTIKETFGLDVGYSDHTPGIEVSIAAVALGAKMIEKHFTLDKKMKGPDHYSSLEPEELNNLVRSIRNVEKCLGSPVKQPSRSEKKNISIARKSIVALKNIKKGELFSESNLTVKRPGTGISPMKWDEVIGKKSKRNFVEDELIKI